MRTGSADLPLHGGTVPRWLADRMTALGTVLTEAIVLQYGRAEFLRRLAHPFWFQSLGSSTWSTCERARREARRSR